MLNPYTAPQAEAEVDKKSRTIRRGHWIVTAVCAGSVAISAAVQVLKTTPTGIVRLLLTVLLMYFLFRGRSWARIWTVILSALGALAGVAFVLSRPQGLLIGMAVFFAWSACALSFFPSVSAFFASRKNA